MERAAALEASGRYVFAGRLAECAYFNMDQVVRSTMDKIARHGVN